MEASAYEVPLSAVWLVHRNKRENENHEPLEATYALPDTYYEYATQEPNGPKVFQCSFKHILDSIGLINRLFYACYYS